MDTLTLGILTIVLQAFQILLWYIFMRITNNRAFDKGFRAGMVYIVDRFQTALDEAKGDKETATAAAAKAAGKTDPKGFRTKKQTKKETKSNAAGN